MFVSFWRIIILSLLSLSPAFQWKECWHECFELLLWSRYCPNWLTYSCVYYLNPFLPHKSHRYYLSTIPSTGCMVTRGHPNHPNHRPTCYYQEPPRECDPRGPPGVGPHAAGRAALRRGPLHVPDQHGAHDHADAQSWSFRYVNDHQYAWLR